MKDSKDLEVKSETKKEPRTTKQKVMLGLKIFGNVVFYAILILLFMISIANINSGGKNGLPNIFGKGYLSVASPSMEVSPSGKVTSSVKEDYAVEAQAKYLKDRGLLDSEGNYVIDYSKFEIGSFDTHAMVVVDVLNDEEKLNLSVGDVVTFYDPNLQALNTHRIVYVQVNEEGKPICYAIAGDKVTKQNMDVFSGNAWGAKYDGEHNALYESMTFIDLTNANDLGDLKGKVTSVKPGWGDVLSNIRANWLFYFVIPVAALLVLEVFLVFKNFMDYRNEKRGITKDGKVVAQDPIDLEAERERMRQELLAELRGTQAAAKANQEEKNVEKEAKEDENSNAPVENEDTNVEDTNVSDNNIDENSSVETEEAAEDLKEDAPAEEKVEETTEAEEEKVEENTQEPQEEKKETSEEDEEFPLDK